MIIISLFAVLFVLANYILIDIWIEIKQDERISFYEDGYEQGLVDAVNVLFHNTENCNITTITIENETRAILDALCLNSNQNNSLP